MLKLLAAFARGDVEVDVELVPLRGGTSSAFISGGGEYEAVGHLLVHSSRLSSIVLHCEKILFKLLLNPIKFKLKRAGGELLLDREATTLCKRARWIRR